MAYDKRDDMTLQMKLKKKKKQKRKEKKDSNSTQIDDPTQVARVVQEIPNSK